MRKNRWPDNLKIIEICLITTNYHNRTSILFYHVQSDVILSCKHVIFDTPFNWAAQHH